MKQINMLESPVRQVFFSYLVPSISATLVTSIYILADTMMIGRGVGGSGIAAMNILLPLYNTYFGIGMMCGVGGSVLFGFARSEDGRQFTPLRKHVLRITRIVVEDKREAVVEQIQIDADVVRRCRLPCQILRYGSRHRYLFDVLPVIQP